MPQPQSPPSTPAASPPQPEAKPPAPDVKRDVETRARVAIETRLKTAHSDAIDNAKIIPPKAADPKGSLPTSKAATASTGSTASATEPPAGAESTTKTEAKAAGSDPAEEAEAQEARYSLKSVRNWARKNPEEAAEIAEQVFHVGKDQSAEWIRVQNKLRKGYDKLEEREKAFNAERDAVQTEAKETVAVLQPISDLFEAVNPNRGTDQPFDHTKIDFDAGDQAFKDLTGVTIDEYMRHRARKGIAINPEMRELKLKAARLEKELEKAKPAEKKPEPEKKEELPPTLAKKWEAEIEEDHPIRQFVDWQKLLTKAMAPYYDADLDEYSKDPEKIASKIVQQKLDELEPAKVEEEKPAPRKPAVSRPAGRNEEERPRARKGDGDLTTESAMRRVMRQPEPVKVPEDMPKDIGARTQWAIQRAQQRARGEHVG